MTRLPTASGPDTARAAWQVLRERRGLLVLTILVLLADTVAALITPRVIGHIVDIIAGDQDRGALTSAVVLLIGIAVLGGLLALVSGRLIARLGELALARVREQVVEKALAIPQDELERAGSGDLLSRVSGDVSVVSTAVAAALPALVRSGLMVGLTLVGLVVLDWRFALAALCAVPVQALALRWYLRTAVPMFAEERIAEADRAETLLEAVDGAPTVRSFGLAARHEAAVADRSETSVAVSLRVIRAQTRFFSRLNGAEFVGLTMILVVAFFLVRADVATVGAATAAALYFHRLFDPINELLATVDDAQYAGAAFARLVGVAQLPDPPVLASPGHPTDATLVGSALRYAYVPGHPALVDVDLTVRPEERVAVVGESGAGKTTLAKVLAGIHQPQAGAVTFGGVPLPELDPAALRWSVALVTQEVHVFAGTLAADLRLVKPDATDAELRHALHVVHATDWVEALSDDLATEVGDGGHQLTATQAQQLALARIVLADPAVVILDEATAEAGSAGARILESAAAAAIEGRSALIVAHRLTQAARADRIIVMADGAVVESGTHDELPAASGPYGELWAAWSGSRVTP